MAVQNFWYCVTCQLFHERKNLKLVEKGEDWVIACPDCKEKTGLRMVNPMNLICPDCGEPYSFDVEHCTNCGHD